MRPRNLLILFSILVCWLGAVTIAQNNQSSPDSGRKVIRKTAPAYPEMAKRMRLAGTVKVTATVSADGSVKSVEPMGGSPVLIMAAQDAVNKWRFAPASGETKEVIEIHFSPPPD